MLKRVEDVLQILSVDGNIILLKDKSLHIAIKIEASLQEESLLNTFLKAVENDVILFLLKEPVRFHLYQQYFNTLLDNEARTFLTGHLLSYMAKFKARMKDASMYTMYLLCSIVSEEDITHIEHALAYAHIAYTILENQEIYHFLDAVLCE